MRLVISVIGLYWLALLYYMGAQWSYFEEYNYGWAVPFLCLYLIWDRLGKVETDILSQTSTPLLSQRVPNLSRNIQLLAIAACALLYAPTRLLHEASPLWRLTTLLWVFEVLALTLLLVQMRMGWRRMVQLAPPIAFFLVAMPWPLHIELPVQQQLARLNTSGSVELLQFLGVPAIQKGNVIELSTGLLGIEKACSGIQSLQASIMIGSFFGILYRLRLRWVVGLVFGGAALAFACNLVRTTILGCIGARYGIGAAAKWHDPAGVTILLVCFMGIWFMARLMRSVVHSGVVNSQISSSDSRPSTPLVTQPSRDSSNNLQLSAYNLQLLAFLCVWFVLVEIGVELWYRAHDNAAADPIKWSVNWPTENATFQNTPVPTRVHQILRFDQGESGTWVDADGHSWQAFFFVWQPAHTVYQRAKVNLYHDPAYCNKAAGWKIRANLPAISLPIGNGVPLTFRRIVLENDGHVAHLFVGADIRGDASGLAGASFQRSRWDDVRAALSGSRIYGQRTIEAAVFGMGDADQATAALQRQLERLIVTAH